MPESLKIMPEQNAASMPKAALFTVISTGHSVFYNGKEAIITIAINSVNIFLLAPIIQMVALYVFLL